MPWYFALFTTLLALYATYGFYQEKRRQTLLRKNGIKIRGEVVGQKFRTRNGSAGFCVIIGFTTLRGQALEVERPFIMGLSPFKKGTSVGLFYQEDNPNNFLVDLEIDQTSHYARLIFSWLMAGFVLLAVLSKYL